MGIKKQPFLSRMQLWGWWSQDAKSQSFHEDLLFKKWWDVGNGDSREAQAHLPGAFLLPTASGLLSPWPLGRLPNIPEPQFPSWLNGSNDAPYWELFLWALLPVQILLGKALSAFVPVSEGRWEGSICSWWGGGWTEWDWAPPYSRGLHSERCRVPWGGDGGSERQRGLLLALPVPICSDLKEETKPTASGVRGGNRIFRNRRHLTIHCSYPPSPDLIKTISVPFH